MKKGEYLTVERLASGLYRIIESHPEKPVRIGGAASTALALNHIVFFEEACEVPEQNNVVALKTGS